MGTRYNRHGEAVLTSTHNLCFEQKYEKYQNFLSENFVFGGEIFYIFEKACVRNEYREQMRLRKNKKIFALITLLLKVM